MRKVAVLTICFVLCTAAISLAGDVDKLPVGMKGFSGMLQGKVVAKVDNGFVLKVEKILKLWKGNEAENPESAIGKKLLIGPGWVKGDNGKWHRNEIHMKFIKSLEISERINIEVRNVEGGHLAILELSGEQRKRVARGGDKEEKEGKKEKELRRGPEKKGGEREREEKSDLPKKGTVVGEVIQLKDLSFKLKVVDASKGAQCLEGETLQFFVQWIKKGGKWVPDPKEVKAFGKLRLGDKAKVEFYRDEQWRVKKLQILKRAGKERQEALRKKQRQAQERENKEKAKKAEREEEKEPEEKERHKRDREEEEEHGKKERKHDEEEQVKKHKENKPANWPKEGAVYGIVTSIGSTTIAVKVLKASKGAQAMVGETVTFYANWIKGKESKWIPDPEEVNLFKSLELEDKVEIRFYFEEHYRVKKLEKD
jgi:hypothetical protein